MSKINEQVNRTKVINLIATISNLEESQVTPHEVKVQEGVLQDETGQIKLSLWGDQVGKFKIGDKIHIVTGWCKEFEGSLQVSTGKFGRMNLIPSEKVE